MRLITLRNLCAAALFSAAIAVPFLPASRLRPQRVALEPQIVSNVQGRVQVYFGDGSGFREAFSVSAPIHEAGRLTIVRLPMLPGRWTELRLDPLEGPGRVTISAPQIIAKEGEVLRTLSIESLVPVRHIESMERRGETIDVSIPAGSDDPQLGFRFDPPLEIPPPWRRFATTFGPLALGVFVTFVGLLAVLERRGRIRARPPTAAGMTFPLSMAAALFLIVWGARLAIIDRFGSDLPFWDQWWKEGLETYIPWFERGELWRNMFAPHNEHRVAPTVGLNLALLEIGGQWDARVQCVVNAALPAAIAAAVLLLAWRRLASGWASSLGAIAALLAASPLAWENIVAGFQSQFSFVIAFSLAAMGGVLGWPAFSWRWWGALAAGALSVFSMGSGFFWALPAAAIAMLRFGRREITRRDAAVILLVSTVFVAAGWCLRTTPPSLEVLHARTANEFLGYAVTCLACPVPQFPAFAALVWAPWVTLLVLRLRGAPNLDRRLADFVLAVGAWVMLNAFAVAYARGASGGLPASRYGDVFALGPLAGFAALAATAACWRGARPAALLLAAVLVAAIAVNANDSLTRALPMRSQEYAAFERSVRDFVASDDAATFAQRPVPFPSANELARVLRHPEIKRILPASVRAPLSIPGFEPARPPEPSLNDRGTRFVPGPGRWESVALPTGRGWWKIETSGALGEPGVSLELVAAADRRVLARIAPTKPAGESWRAAYVHAPSEPAVFVARADPVGKWLAFGEPIEVPALSYRAWRLAQQGVLIVCFATAAAMALVILQPLAAGRPQDPS